MKSGERQNVLSFMTFVVRSTVVVVVDIRTAIDVVRNHLQNSEEENENCGERKKKKSSMKKGGLCYISPKWSLKSYFKDFRCLKDFFSFFFFFFYCFSCCRFASSFRLLSWLGCVSSCGTRRDVFSRWPIDARALRQNFHERPDYLTVISVTIYSR